MGSCGEMGGRMLKSKKKADEKIDLKCRQCGKHVTAKSREKEFAIVTITPLDPSKASVTFMQCRGCTILTAEDIMGRTPWEGDF